MSERTLSTLASTACIDMEGDRVGYSKDEEMDPLE